MLPDAQTALSNPCLEFNTEYPWAFTLAGKPSPAMQNLVLSTKSILLNHLSCTCVHLL